MTSFLDKVHCAFIQLPKSLKWWGVILIGVVLLIIRNADPLLNPAMYAEDGKWRGMAYTSGWLNTLLNAEDVGFPSQFEVAQ